MNRDINFNYDLDYSKDKNIDKRILEVCAIAEAKYLENQKKQKSKILSKEIDVNDLIINNNDNRKIINKNKINEIKKTLETSNSNVQNKSYFTASKLGKIGNKSLDIEKNLLSQRFFNKNIKMPSPFQKIQNINSFSISKNPMTTKNKHIQLNGNDFLSKSQNNFYRNNMNKTQKLSTSNTLNNKINYKSYDKSKNNIDINKSIQKKYKPLFSKTINKKYLFAHDKHILNKNQLQLNKILLQSQTLIKNHKYVSAYYLLRNTISTGEYHSDLFYLYGEVNRVLKNYQNAEDYLLLALNFEIHSPYVFYSMGLLYQNLNEYNYSNIFLKLFQRLINNDNVHFLIAKNYMGMGELIKAAKELTIAIEMNNENDSYYKFRSEIYKKLGLTEMSIEDLNMYNYIRNIKIEENK